MVNHGRRSGACSLCKQRKVKCDETKPQCLRCQKYGRECPGIPQAKPSAFRWRYKTYDPGEDATFADAASNRGSSKSPVTFNGDTLDSFVQTEKKSIDFWLDNFVANNFLTTYMPAVYDHCTRPSAMSHIVTATAIDCFARHEGVEKRYALRSLKEYHNALQALRVALETPHLAQQNETLAAVLMLIAWESHTIHHESVRPVGPQQRHNVGGLTLLRNRGTSQFDDPTSLTLFRQARNHIFMSVAFRPAGLHLLYTPGFDWFADRDFVESEETRLNSKLIQAGWHIPLLRHRSAELFKQPYTGTNQQCSEAQLLLRQAQMIGSRLQHWKGHLPIEWMPVSNPYTPTQEELEDAAYASAWPGPITTYESLLIAMVFNNFHVLRLLATTTCLRIAQWLTISPAFSSFDFALDIFTWQTLQQELIDDICSATPYQTGEYPSDFPSIMTAPSIHPEPKTRDFLGSYMVYYPLAVASREAAMPMQQAAWIKEQLDRIEQVNGCGMSCNLFFSAGSGAPSEGTPEPTMTAQSERYASKQPSKTQFKHSDHASFEEAAAYDQ